MQEGGRAFQEGTRDDSPLAYGGQQKPYQGISGPQIIMRVVPVFGVCNEYTVMTGGQQVLGRYDMGPPTRILKSGKLKPDPRPYISRMQCLVSVEVDGAITLRHTGKNHRPTARLAPNGNWYYLKKGEVHVLTEGERFSLDSKDPESAVYTIYVEKGGSPPQQAQGGYSQQGGYGSTQQRGDSQQQGGY